MDNIIKCWVCMDKGSVIEKIPVNIGNEICHNWYSLYCDKCETGKRNRVDYTNKEGSRYYEDPISKYFDTSIIERKNIELKKNNARCEK